MAGMGAGGGVETRVGCWYGGAKPGPKPGGCHLESRSGITVPWIVFFLAKIFKYLQKSGSIGYHRRTSIPKEFIRYSHNLLKFQEFRLLLDKFL
jgi:hypothetical protein